MAVVEPVDWTFPKISTKEFTHGFHTYPARMHPEIAKQLIERYASDTKKVVFDPFMGSGGVLVEAILHGNNAIGIDINPFSVFLSKVKTTPLDVTKLSHIFEEILEKSSAKQKPPDNAPKDLDLDFWYPKGVPEKLKILKHHIFEMKVSEDEKNFFKLCFSLTQRKVSYQKTNIYKIYRVKPEKREGHNPDVFGVFTKICKTNIENMEKFASEIKKSKGQAITILGDTRNAEEEFKKISNKILDEGKAHLVVTSPPYGDHGTTVAYGQFSRHPGQWLELPEQEKLSSVDKVGLGGKRKKEFSDLGSPLLDKVLDIIKKKDIESKKTKEEKNADDKKLNHYQRARDVFAFFYDLDECFLNISKVLKKGDSHCCFVVANRRVRRETIPTDKIIVELAKKYGFRHKETIYRKIINKAMASKNTPENIADLKDETMNEESIVIWEY
ncbi:MAG: DNA adenine methylase [Nitrosarchaeum sp.]|nr:DNA adenine methylase [Nitrosarchaeum sp.]